MHKPEVEKALNKIKECMLGKGWSYNDLAAAAGMPTQTIKNWYNKQHSEPSPHALLDVCAALGLKMSELWAENELVELSGERKELFEAWQKLTKSKKDVVMLVINEFCKHEK